VELQVSLPFQTRGIERRGISPQRIVGLEDIEDVLIAISRSSLRQGVRRIGDERKPIKDASNSRR
jgi:hypothetical protein